MSIDECLQFLLQSTESLHTTGGEFDAENIRTLARIAQAHETRIERLEDDQSQ